MTVAPGSQFGPYEVVGPLGAGGMGEVYRARDPRLGRDVAIKILPASFAADASRLARFDREARVLASLNHPHIAAIYGIEEVGEVRALVLELVEGETLADTIRKRKMLPADEASRLARQIGEALDAAHERGIVHRDLKPANIIVTPAGTLKVLDFGLAKDTVAAAGTAGLTHSPTMMTPTVDGVLLGTAPYMSPEQVRGKPVDKRADIWAFGCVVYEMITGRQAFPGATISDHIAAILEREPDWGALPTTTPPAVARLLRRCLDKDPRRRLRDIGDGMLDLDTIPVREPVADSLAKQPHRRSRWIAFGGALAACIATAAGVWLFDRARTRETPRPVLRFTVPLQPNTLGLGRRMSALSPDGRTLVYAAGERLYVRRLDDLDARPLAGTEPAATTSRSRVYQAFATMPFFSPDSQWVGFLQNGQLKKVPIAGGAAVTLCDVGNPYSASWAGDGTVLYAQGGPETSAAGIWRLPSAGGTPERIIALDQIQTPLDPQLLPDGSHVLFALATAENWDAADIVVQAIGTSSRDVVIRGAVTPLVAGDILLYASRGALFATRFDTRTRRAVGSAVPIESGIAQSLSAGGWPGVHFSVASDGTLAYLPSAVQAARRIPIWVDRQGHIETLPGERRAYQYPRISPDGTLIAFDMRDQENDIWIMDVARATLARLTMGRRSGGAPVWSPDGRYVVFVPQRDGRLNLFRQPASGTGAEERLLNDSRAQSPFSFTPDGRWLVFSQAEPGAGTDLYLLAMDGSRTVKPLLQSPFVKTAAEVSPDGRWLAYQSNESGRAEVYVRPFPNVNAQRWQISPAGGTRPLWSRNGRELFYLDPDRRLAAVAVNAGPSFSAATPRPLFETKDFGLEGAGRNFDISPDGSRFLFVDSRRAPDDGVSAVVVANWLDDVRRRIAGR